MAFFLSPQEITRAVSARLHSTPQKPIEGISTDTRENCQGKLFFPLKGEHFDGHDYLKEAIRSGASGIICQNNHKLPADVPQDVRVFYVNDTLKAYQDLAKALREKFKPMVLAITGSHGKTTAKAFLATLLEKQYNTLASKASFNNHIGVPKTLLQIQPETQRVVLEMGMNHPGEIKTLVQIANPDVVVVTTVGRSHLEGLKNLEQVAQAKEEIYKYARKEATRIFNLDNPWTQKMHQKYSKSSKTLIFSKCDKTADICLSIKNLKLNALEVTGHIQGVEGQAELELFGGHHLNNLMVASCCGLVAGLSPRQIWSHLKDCKSQWGRGQVITLKNQSKVIFDAYNANPDSMEALLTHIAKCPIQGKWHICLGDMLELGPSSQEFHKQLGQKLAELILSSQRRIGLIAFVGQFGKAFKEGLLLQGFDKDVVLFDKYEPALASHLKTILQPMDMLVLKASRRIQLEKLLMDLN